MVKSAPMRDHSIVIKPRRRAGKLLAALLVLLMLSGVMILGLGFFAPARIALAQERVVAALHGGVATSEERTFVDACVILPGANGPQAVTRTTRTTIYNDGAAISVTFSSPPTPSNGTC
jgi:hypothetical protein